MLDTYKVIKSKVVASCKYYWNYYEIRVWFEGYDLDGIYGTYNIGMSTLKEAAGVKRGDSFKKIQEFLDANEGKEWLGEHLRKQDYEKEADNIKNSIRVSLYKMDLEQLKEFDMLGKEIRNTENNLTCPAIYKHFKGKYYATMGTSEPIDISKFDFKVNYLKTYHTETGANVFIIIDNKNNFYHDKTISNEKFVLYKSLYDDTGIYIRPMDMFLSEVDKNKYPEVEQKYRFERVVYER